MTRLFLVVCALGCAAVVGAALLVYPWQAIVGSATRVAILAALSLGAIASAGLARARRNARIGAVMVIVIVLAGALGIEAYLGQPRFLNTRLQVAIDQGIDDFDPRHPVEVVLDDRAAGRDIFVQFSPSQFYARPLSVDGRPVIPLANLISSELVYCNEGGKYARFRTDEYGFNNPPGIWADAPVDAVVIGDSFVQGACVARDDNFVEALRRRIPKVLNLGRDGLGLLAELAVLCEYGAVARPKVVIWAYFEGNDLENLENEYDVPILRNYLKPDFSQRLVEDRAAVDRSLMAFPRDFIHPMKARLRRVFLGTRHFLRFGLPVRLSTLCGSRRDGRDDGIEAAPGRATPTRHATAPDPRIRRFRTVMTAVARETKALGTRLVVVYIPSIKSFPEKPPALARAKDQVVGVMRDLGVPMIDSEPVLRATGEPMGLYPFRIESHLTPQGYAILARLIGDGLAPAGHGDGR